jgi:zinc protease
MSDQPESHRLKNGLTVIALRRGSVPLVGLRLAFPAGSAHAGSGRSGLAELTAQLLRRGCRGRAVHAIDEALETLGADLAVGVDDDATRLGLTVPTARLEPALELLLRLAASPTFPVAELLSQRRRTLASIRSGLDDAGEVAERALNRELFRGHPYERPIEGWSREVAKLSRSDVVGFQKARYLAGGACLVAAGGVPADIHSRLVRASSGLAEGPTANGPPSAPPVTVSGVLIVDKPDATQAQLRIGATGIASSNPDLPACLLGNTVLGGGFSSRLVNEVRVERGLAYGISSSFHANLAGGVFVIRSSTRIDEAAALVQVSLDEVERLRAEGPTEAEVAQASAYLRGNFAMANETGEQACATLAGAFLQGFGSDWLERFPQLLASLTRADVSRALERYLPGSRRVVAVGPARKLAKSLRKFGPIEVVALDAVA